MSQFIRHTLIHEMPDGTLKMTNPLTGRSALWVPGRRRRPPLHPPPD